MNNGSTTDSMSSSCKNVKKQTVNIQWKQPNSMHIFCITSLTSSRLKQNEQKLRRLFQADVEGENINFKQHNSKHNC